MCGARDVCAVGDDDDRAAAGPFVADQLVRGQTTTASYSAVPEWASTVEPARAPPAASDGDAEKRVSAICRAAEGDDADVVVRSAAAATNDCAAVDGGGERLAAHRLRPVDREHDALVAAEVDGLEAGHRVAVLDGCGGGSAERPDDA